MVVFTVLCVVCRLHYSPEVFLEIYCSDGTFARSHDSSGRYFTCWSPSNKDSSTVLWSKRVYSTEHAPPIVGGNQGLSLARALGRGERLLYTASQLRDVATCSACWNSKEDLTSLPVPSLATTSSLPPLHPLTPAEVPTAPSIVSAAGNCVAAQQDVEGVGCFKVYVSGRIVVRFQDTTHLETYLPGMDMQHRGYVRGGEGERMVEGTCWVRLRSGQTETVPLKFEGNRLVCCGSDEGCVYHTAVEHISIQCQVSTCQPVTQSMPIHCYLQMTSINARGGGCR